MGFKRFDEKAAALLAEVESKGKKVQSFSADIVFRITGTKSETLTGKLLIQRPALGRAEFRRANGEIENLEISDGTTYYTVQGKKYTKQPATNVAEQIWPYLNGIPERGTIQPTYRGTELVGGVSCEVVEYVQPGLTARFSIDSERIIRRIVSLIGASGTPQTQELLLSNIILNRPIAASNFVLPPGLVEDKPIPVRTVVEAEKGALTLGRTAPAFQLSPTVALPNHKVTLVVFWSVGNSPSRAVLPEIQRLYTKHKVKGLEVLALCDGGTDASALAFGKAAHVTFPLAVATPALVKAYGVEVFPTSFLLDSRGKLVYRKVGYEAAGLKTALARLGFS